MSPLRKLDKFSAISGMTHFSDFLFAFLYTNSLLKKGSIIEGKNLLP